MADAPPLAQRLIADLTYLEQAEASADEGPLGEPAARGILAMALRNTRAALLTINRRPALAEIPEPTPEWEAKARAFAAQVHAAHPVEPAQTLVMLRRWTADAEPANEHGQVSFARAMLESAEAALEALFARCNRIDTAARAVLAVRPVNWNDAEDPEQSAAWPALAAAIGVTLTPDLEGASPFDRAEDPA